MYSVTLSRAVAACSEPHEGGLHAPRGGRRPGAALRPVRLLRQRPARRLRLRPPLQHHRHSRGRPGARGQRSNDTEETIVDLNHDRVNVAGKYRKSVNKRFNVFC